MAKSPTAVANVTRIVFIALLIDILAFTLILPLFPRLLQFYRDSEHGDQVRDESLGHCTFCMILHL